MLCALTYDGRIECSPWDRDDEWIRDLVNRHQRTDKGFGPALGPDAAAAAAAAFEEAQPVVAASDWRLDVRHADLQRQLVDGWAAAAGDMARDATERIDGWRARRQTWIARGTSSIIVGHRDLAAFRPQAR